MRLKLSILGVVLGLLLSASPALAGKGRLFTGTFGGASSIVPDPYPLSAEGHHSVAVDNSSGPSSGDIYVTDPHDYRVEKFDSAGHFILMFGEDVNKTKVEEGASEAERDVCTAASLDECQPGIKGTGPGAFTEEGLYVAVDDSTGPSAGDVYVADTITEPEQLRGKAAGEGEVTKFDEEGHVMESSWGTGGQLDGSSAGPFGAMNGVTVDSSGNLWVYGTGEEEYHGAGGVITYYYSLPRVFELGQDGTFVQDWSRSEGPDGERESPGRGIAVDSEGHVYLNVGQIKKYTSSGKLIQVIGSNNKVVVNTQGSFAFDPSSDSIYEATARVEFINEKGELALEEQGINRYEASCPAGPLNQGCVPAETFRSSHLGYEPGGLTVNFASPLDTLYAVESGNINGSEKNAEVETFSLETLPHVVTDLASGFTKSLATLNGTVNPEGVAVVECYFEWGEVGKPYKENTPCEALPGSGNAPVAVHASISMTPGTAYHFRLVVANSGQLYEPTLGAEVVFGPPSIDSTSVVQLTTESATFQAEVNPRNQDTEYHFEYLTEAEFDENGESFGGPPHPATSVPLTDAALGSGHQDLLAEQHVRGLTPQTAYRYRIVARSPLAEAPLSEAVDGPVESFETWGTGAFGLPDARQWEMVSAPDDHGALLEPIGEDWAIQAAADGGGIAYVADAPTESTPAGYLLYQSVLATRGAEGGWSSHDLSIPHLAPTDLSVGQGWEYRLFSEDLARAIVNPFGEFVACTSPSSGAEQPCLSPEATEQTAFLDTLYAGGGDSGEPCTASCFTPLVTAADTPPGTRFGKNNAVVGQTCPPDPLCGPQLLDATPDLSHVLLISYTALTASPAPNQSIPLHSLYEWSEGAPPGEQLRLVSVLPGKTEEAVPAKVEAGGVGVSKGNIRHAISDDGERVVWGAENHLYLREHATRPQSLLGASGECLEPADACTVQVNAGLSGELQFQTANSEVTRIFFTQGEKQAFVGGDLYEYNVETGKPRALTSGAEMVGLAIGASKDGSWLYFTANGALTKHAVKGNCSPEGNPTEKCNLYVMHYDGTAWETRLVAVLTGRDVVDWGGPHGYFTELAARVSPNGEWLAFMSSGRPTGYDNRDANSGEPDQEVYEYGAASGTLVCASCNPTGARPHGVSSQKLKEEGLVTGKNGFSGWLAANVPGWTPNGEVEAIYQSRYLSDSGRLFFDSSDQLVPKDTNGTEDVYEYEPEGVPKGEHACTSSSQSGSVVFKPARGVQVEGKQVQEGAGCVGLISNGESPQESAFLDASETGSEVFFLSDAKLSKADVEGGRTLYDAHECTAQSPCATAVAESPPPCTNEASCKPAPSPQPEIYGPPVSATFSGPGDLVQPLVTAPPPKKVTTKTVKCKHGFVKKKVKKKATCVKAKTKKKAKKSSRGPR